MAISFNPMITQSFSQIISNDNCEVITSQIITMMLSSGWMISYYTFGVTIWLDVNIYDFTRLDNTFPSHFVLSSGWMII